MGVPKTRDAASLSVFAPSGFAMAPPGRSSHDDRTATPTTCIQKRSQRRPWQSQLHLREHSMHPTLTIGNAEKRRKASSNESHAQTKMNSRSVKPISSPSPDINPSTTQPATRMKCLSSLSSTCRRICGVLLPYMMHTKSPCRAPE